MAQSTVLRVIEVGGALAAAGALILLLRDMRQLRADVRQVDRNLAAHRQNFGQHATHQNIHTIAMRRHREAIEPPGAGI